MHTHRPQLHLALSAVALALVAGCQPTEASRSLEDQALNAQESPYIADPPEDSDNPDPGDTVPPPPDPPEVVEEYSCFVDEYGATDCDPSMVDAAYAAPNAYYIPQGQWVLNASMAPFQQMDVYAWVCDPTGWAMHVADSPTCNGYGGDAATSDHDAEGYLFAQQGNPSEWVEFFSAYDMSRGVPGTYVKDEDAFPGACDWVRMTFFHNRVTPNSCFYYSSSASSTTVKSLHGAKLGYPACGASTSTQRSIECDWEDSGLADKENWYVGLNRTVGSASRSGTGVQFAYVVLSSAPTPDLPWVCTF